MGTDLQQPAARNAANAQKTPRTIPAEDLFGGDAEVRIRYAGQEYRLRKTRNGKLILTK